MFMRQKGYVNVMSLCTYNHHLVLCRIQLMPGGRTMIIFSYFPKMAYILSLSTNLPQETILLKGMNASQ